MNRKQRRASGKAHPPSPPSECGEDFIALHAAGIEAWRAGRLDDAAALIARAIAANGQMPDFHYNLAIVLRAQDKLGEAAAAYERAILLKPDYAQAHNNLGNVRKALGELDAARASFERALHHKPGNADTLYNLAILCRDLGERETAAAYFRRCLNEDQTDPRGVKMLLAHLGLASVPEQVSQAQLLSIYDVRSRFWDRESAYFGHTLVAQALRKHVAAGGLDILDIGCGTGLAGAPLRNLASTLDGADLSPAMLDKARSKALYDGLYESDFVVFMSGHADSYDAIVGAAALIHFGNLEPVFRAASTCLRPAGLFVFTLFSGEAAGADFAVAAHDRLAQTGCYMHRRGYVERLASTCGFQIESLEEIIHEHDQSGDPVTGLLAVLRRQ